MIADTEYRFHATRTTLHGLSDPVLYLYDSRGVNLALDDDSGGQGNARIAYSCLLSGTYYLGVRDYSSGVGAYTLAATYPIDDHPNTMATTGQLVINGPARSGTIDTVQDADWFGVTLNAGTLYQLRATRTGSAGLTDPYLTLYNGRGEEVTSDDDQGGGGNSLIRFTPSVTGTFYLGVRDYGFGTGSYLISATVDDFAGSRMTTGRVAVNGTAVAGTIEGPEDQDWFAVNLTSRSTYRLRVTRSGTTSGLVDPYATLFDGQGNPVTSNNDGGIGNNAQITFTPESSGTYYLGVRDFSTGTGRYTVSVANPDDFDSSVATTGRLVVNAPTATRGKIERGGDRDWFAITLNAGTAYQLRAEGTTTLSLSDPYLTLYNAQGRLITSNNNSGSGNNALIRYTPTLTGTYYLGVRGDANTDRGFYTVSAVSADDYGGSSTTSGSLSTTGTVRTGIIERVGDEDWFAVTLNAGTSYSVRLNRSTTDGLNNPYLSLFNSSGVLIATNNDGGLNGNARLVYTPLVTGTYYVGARDVSSGTGNYRLSAIVTTTTNLQDDFLSTMATTGRVTVNQTTGTSGRIETAWDNDLFAVTLTAGISYRLSATAAVSAGLTDPFLTLYDPQGTAITYNDDHGNTRDSLIIHTPTESGTYYLGVKDYSNGTGSYTVSAITGDDYGDSASAAGVVLVNEEAESGQIERSGDQDWFLVVLSADTPYQFHATSEIAAGLTDPLLTLLDGYGNVLTSNDNAHSGTHDSLIRYTPTTEGIYFLQVSDRGTGIGAYTVSALTDDDYAEAVTTTGRVTPNGSVTGMIESTNDRDWFQVDLVAGHGYAIDLLGEPSGNGTVLDPFFYGVYTSSGELIGNTSNDDSGDSVESYMLFIPETSGSYYLSAGAYGTYTGSYLLRVNDVLATDIANTVQTTATLEVDGRAESRIELAQDVDWFRVTLTAGETYIIEQCSDSSSASPLRDPYFRGVYTAAGTRISGTSNDDYGLGLDSRVQFTPERSGTYYLAAGAASGTGDYLLTLTARTNSNDNVADSTETTASITVDGDSVDGVIDTAFERDWYRVSLTSGQNYEISVRGAASNSGSLSDPVLIGVYDADGRVLPGTGNQNAQGTSDAFSTFRPASSGTYYLAVGGYADNTGTFRLSINTSNDTDVPDNVTTSATMTTEYRGRVEAVWDVDWIRVALTAGTTYRIQELGSSGGHGTLRDPMIHGIYDSNGLALPGTSNDDVNDTRNSEVTFTAPVTGNFYLAAGAYGTETGSYFVTMTAGDPDTSQPQMVNAIPATINPASNLTLTFNETMRAGSGNLRITGGGETITIAITSPQVTISGETVTINPGQNLADNTSYTLSIDNGALTDLAGNAYAANTNLSFATSAITDRDTWTIMFYIDGDNDLESYAIDDLNEMESVTIPEGINLVTLLDRIPGYDSSNGNWSDTRQGVMLTDSNPNTVTSFSGFSSLGEQNLGNPASLTRFINWAATNNPADHYALVVWDHGGGLSGSCWDDTNNGDNLTANELRSAIDNSNVDHFDLIGFDACLMGMTEQAWDLRNLTDVMVASEELIPGTGWAYDLWLRDLANNPNMSATDLGSRIVQTYAQRNAGEEDISLSAIQSNQLTALNTAMEAFASRALSLPATSQEWQKVRQAAERTVSFGGEGNRYNYRDLGDFMNNVASRATDANLVTAANHVVAQLDQVVSANAGTIAGASGLSIYLPYGSRPVDASYTATNHSFLSSSSWETFLATL
ncbi:MAG: hypothetical protein G8237_07975 [Magnetococcales bacterium]|nr:hypothetical protein [Magnetococcales bacterium]